MKRFQHCKTTEFAVQLLSAAVILFTFSVHILIMAQEADTTANASLSQPRNVSLILHHHQPQQQLQQLQKRSPFYPYFHHHFHSINKTLIVLPEGANKTAIKENFQQFLNLFSIDLKKTVIDFNNAKGKLCSSLFYIHLVFWQLF